MILAAISSITITQKLLTKAIRFAFHKIAIPVELVVYHRVLGAFAHDFLDFLDRPPLLEINCELLQFPLDRSLRHVLQTHLA
jgi:hypothetical protein